MYDLKTQKSNPEIAVATVAAKLGFLDKEDAICSTKCCCRELVFMSSINLFKNVGFVVTSWFTSGTVNSAWDGWGWLCSPSYVATKMDGSLTLLCTYKLSFHLDKT